MNYRDLNTHLQEKVQKALKGYFGREFEIDEYDEFSSEVMRYGYIAISERNREILVCDSTPDDGDTLISVIRMGE